MKIRKSDIVKRGLLLLVITAVFIAFVVYINQVDKTEIVSRAGQTFEKAVVTDIVQDNIQPDGSRSGEQVVKVKMTSGELKGQTLQVTSASGFLFGAACEKGMHVIVMQSVAGDSNVTTVYAQNRGLAIIIFAAVYLALLCIVGGKQGAKGALALVFTVVCIIFVFLPLVYRGLSPFWVAVGICAITTLVTMYFIGGFSKKTVAATIGTVAGVIIAGIAAAIFGSVTGISGWNVSDIESLMVLSNTNDVQIGGLLFSGILISSLGAMMDVGMSMASSIAEIQAQNPVISRLELFRAGMRVGRDLMSTDSNTLILAFAGGSISTLLLDYAYDLPFTQIINSNNIGISIMQGLSGSMGIVLCIPATVFIASLFYTWKGKKQLTENDRDSLTGDL